VHVVGHVRTLPGGLRASSLELTQS